MTEQILDESKSLIISVRLSLNDYAKLRELMKILKLDKSKVMRNALEIYYKLVKKSGMNLYPTNVNFEKVELGHREEIEEIKKELQEIKSLLQSGVGSPVNVKALKKELEKLKSTLKTFYTIAQTELEKKRYEILYKRLELISNMLMV